MKAIHVTRFGGPEVLRLADIAAPEPETGQVRVRLYAAGVNPVDTYIRTGTYAMGVPPLPYTPGSDGAGVVEALGPGVEDLAVGQRVFVAAVLAGRNTGTYAEAVVCDAEAVRPLPDTLSYAQGAGLGTPGLAAVNALLCRARVLPGETVLIHGASGGMGTLAVQLARRMGATVCGTAGTEEGLALLRELGAHHVFCHRDPGYQEEIRRITGGVDVIVEALANRNLAADMTLLAKYGRVVIVGSRGPLEFDPRLVMTAEATILGMTLGNMPSTDFAINMAELSAALDDGLQPVVAGEIPLAQAELAHRQVLEQSGSRGKLVLRID